MNSRIVRLIIFIIVIFLIQYVVLAQFTDMTFKPDLLLVFIIAAAFLGDGMEGIYIGIACGAFVDITTTSGLGFYAFLGLSAALFAKIFNQRLFRNNVFVFILTTIYVSTAYEIIGFIFHSILDFISGEGISSIKDFTHYAMAYAAPVILANGLAAAFIFYIVRGLFFMKREY